MSPLDIVRRIATKETASLLPLVERLTGRGAASTEAWLVLQHGGLLPQASSAFERAGLISRFDARQQATLRTAVEASALRNALLRRLALDVTRRLHSAGIPVMWVKGIWLAHYVYRRPAQRTMSDVDVFVPAGRRAEAVTVLGDAGFAHDPVVEQAGLEVFADSLQPPAGLAAGQEDLSVDVHDSLTLSSGRVWPMADVWKEATAARTGRVEVLLPRPEDGLRMAAIHAVKHGLDPRHLIAAMTDTVAILECRSGTFDVAFACRSIDDPFEAAALHVLLSAVGPAALPPPGREVLERATATTRRHRTLGLADRLIASADHAAFFRPQDFSLFEVGERGFAPSAAVRLVTSAFRWRRRVRAGVTRGEVGPAGLSRIFGANWRVARTTYLAGRLSRETLTSQPLSTAARARHPDRPPSG